MLDDREKERLEMAARLREALDAAPSKTQIADACGVRIQALTGWTKTGRVHKRHLPTIARMSGKSLRWLLGEEDPPHQNTQPTNAPPPTPPDPAALLPLATPRSRSALERIIAAARDGRLSDDDLELLHQIAERIARRT